jgi:rieske iron-sulfur protein
VLAALVAGTCFATTRPLAAEDDRPGSDERPEASDLLVFPTATVKATS